METVNGSLSDRIRAEISSFQGVGGATAGFLELMNDPDPSFTAIEEALRLDPGLTATILKLSNAAYFGFSSQISSVQQAIVRLGINNIFKIVTSAEMSTMMSDPVPGYNLLAGDLLRHSIAVSIAAEGLLEELKLPKSGEVFTAALLHDIGKIVLSLFVKEKFHEIDTAVQEGMSFEVAEYEILQTNHAMVGSQILENWSFPPALIHATRWHHDPDGAKESSQLIDIVHIADVLSLMMGIGSGNDGLQYSPAPGAASRLGISAMSLERVASRTLQGIEEVTAIFEAS
jgi:putative nucleotidyltransferase with HDIG domain